MKAGRPSKDKKDALELSDVTDKPKKSTRVNFNLDEDTTLSLNNTSLIIAQPSLSYSLR